MAAKIPTIMATDKSPDEYNSFMSGADPTTHSSQQGLQVYLTQFENFGSLDAGKFSSSGTIGEIKLFATLQILLSVKDDVLQGYPNAPSGAPLAPNPVQPKQEVCEGDTRGDRTCSHDPTHRVCARIGDADTSFWQFIENTSNQSNRIAEVQDTACSLLSRSIISMLLAIVAAMIAHHIDAE